MKPTVSAIIPSYNYGRFLREAVDSALAQTYRDLEIIVVDDGSKDNTAEVMTAYVGNPSVRYIRQVNTGLPGARNTGFRNASGKYLALLDADDIWEPTKIEQQVAFYEHHPEAGIVATDSYDFTNRPISSPSPTGGEDQGKRGAAFNEYTIRDLLEFSAFRPSSVMISRAAWEAVDGFDAQMKYVEDLDMWVRLGAQFRIYRLNSSLTGMRMHGAVQSMHITPNLDYHLKVLDKLFTTVPAVQAHPAWRRLAEARMYIHVSWMRYCAGDRRGALQDTLRSIVYWPSALRDPNRAKQRWKRTMLLYRYALK